jgi:uncharacterized protein (TIGR00730 family)
MKRISVFCGSSSGTEKVFEEQAFLVGKTLAQLNIEVVYGGASIGLMGKVADGALENGGKVIGVLPRFFGTREIAHAGLSELIMVDTMHERKMKMHELSDAVITLPGGFGTMEELFEMLTWAQLGLHTKPIGVLNCNGFYTDLIGLIQTMVDKGFLKKQNQDMLLFDNNISGLLEKLKNYKAPVIEKWLTTKTT